MDSFYRPDPDDDQRLDPVMALWRMDSEARGRRVDDQQDHASDVLLPFARPMPRT